MRYGVTVRNLCLPYQCSPSLFGLLFVESVSVNKFRDNLKAFVESTADRHEPLRVTRRNGTDFIVMSVDDWESEQETLYILQDPYLMSQIRAARQTSNTRRGYRPTQKELDEILSVSSE